MFKKVILLLILVLFNISIYAKDGFSQKHLLSVSPIKGAQNVRPNSLIKITFDREIIQKGVKTHTIILKSINHKGKKLRGKVTISDESTLVFTPNKLLQEGVYRVKIKPIKLKANKDDYELSSFMKKALYWLCSWFYDDISECPLYKKFYKIPSFIKTKTIKYSFNVIDEPEVLSIKLNKSSIALNEGEFLQLNAVASYDDNSTKDVTQEVVWSISEPQIASIDTNATLTAIQEGTAQITATLENITSQILSLSVRKIVNGHLLPPEPDPTLNNSTLLGIDVNNNGVRDDVERKIYLKYKRPIEQVYMMQSAKIYPQTLEDPAVAATSEELEKEHWDSSVCEGYLRNYKKVPLGVQTVTFMEEAYFNTKQRMRAYIEFNEASSGGVFHIPLLRDYKESNCDFNVTKMLELE